MTLPFREKTLLLFPGVEAKTVKLCGLWLEYAAKHARTPFLFWWFCTSKFRSPKILVSEETHVLGVSDPHMQCFSIFTSPYPCCYWPERKLLALDNGNTKPISISLRLSRFGVLFTRESRMLRASLPSYGRPSVCLSVRPSHS